MGTNEFLKVLPEMVTFMKVAQFASFSAAAQDIGITPSAASRQVSRLEKQLRVQLIQRTTRQLRLTEAGIEAFARCCELVNAAQATMQVAEQHAAAPHGRVSVAAPKAFARRVLSPLLLSFLTQYPDVDVQVVVTDRDIDPIKEGIDLVFRLTHQPPEGLAARPLCRVENVLCATPEFVARTGPIDHPEHLIGRSCLCLGEQTMDNRWRLRRGDEVVEVVVNGRLAVNHSEIRLEGVLAHLGVGYVPDFIAGEALASGRVVRVLPDWQVQSAYAGLAYLLFPPNRFMTPKCRVLIDHVVGQLGARAAAPSHRTVPAEP